MEQLNNMEKENRDFIADDIYNFIKKNLRKVIKKFLI